MVGMEPSSSQSALILNPTDNSDQPLGSKLDIATGNDRKDLSAEQPPPQQLDPTQKDVHLREFLSKMDDYAPIVTILANHSHTHQ